MQQQAYTSAQYEAALRQEDQARSTFHNNLLVFGLVALAIGGFILSLILWNPFFFALVYGFALIAGWHLGLPYYRFRQARDYTRRLEAWRFATHAPPTTGIAVTETPPGYCPNDVQPDPDPRSYYQQGYSQQGSPSQMV